MKKKTKALKKASTKNKVIKPVKAFTGLEIALLTGAGTMLAGEMMKPKSASASPYDPFKKYDPAMTPAQYVAKQTSATDITGESLNPITSEGESASRSVSTGTGTTDNEQEETKAMKTGGMVRGQGKAIRGTRFKGIF
jgi:hypothetical protein